MTEEQKDEKLAQAYQVIASLLGELGALERGLDALDYFSSDKFEPDFLPWPGKESQ